MRFTTRKLAAVAAFGLLGTGVGVALAQGALPPVESQHGIDYLSGGIGQGEAHAIEKAEPRWPLTMEFAQRSGHQDDFLADVRIVVRDAKHHTVLDATSDGPFMLARLEPGRYAVDATANDRTLHESVRVQAHGAAKAVFIWPSA